jgi:hypothetical protein
MPIQKSCCALFKYTTLGSLFSVLLGDACVCIYVWFMSALFCRFIYLCFIQCPVYILADRQEVRGISSEPQDFVIFSVHEVPASVCVIVFVRTQRAWCSHTVPKYKGDKPFLLFVFSKSPCRSHSTLKLYCHHHLFTEQVCSSSDASNLFLENDWFESQLGLCQQVFF